ncbi:MAG: single-stranded-DNA-specific exonuclease RecJ [Halothece sp.]
MSYWKIVTQEMPPQWFKEAVESYHPNYSHYIAQLLWQRGICDLASLAPFLDPSQYISTSGFAGFGQQMKAAIARLQKAWENQEKVTIWGDFDADGITATSVLWEGLKPFFPTPEQLSYYIPNRLTESHGLNYSGLEKLAQAGVTLVITCDTGSMNLEEIKQAKNWGIDVIVTDHHTLPAEDPKVVAILNPKYLKETHPLYHLSGVAVAYKLVESLYESFPDIPEQSAEELLDLVAIGLVADLVELRGDCRYLAQKGIKKLAKQRDNPTRPGVAELLKLCKKNGDRPMDISFGLGPRINAISRIQGDASFAVELLTSREEKTCQRLAQETDAANSRRKQLQKETENAVKKQIEKIDLSTTGVIVLADREWHPGVLGLVAGQIAQTYARPTILLNLYQDEDGVTMARGSARSLQEIDLYDLLYSQLHLLDRFGGHPFAAGLSIKAENLPLFQEAINQKFRQKYGNLELEPTINIDLTVTVQELGQALFQAIKLLEPYGMGNPTPQLLIKNCWFSEIWNKNIEDNRGKKISYIRTSFQICDQTKPEGFSGIWWGHYKEDLPENQSCDAVVELDFNAYERDYQVRLIDVKLTNGQPYKQSLSSENVLILDQRQEKTDYCELKTHQPIIKLETCPRSWRELSQGITLGIKNQSAVALAYSLPPISSPRKTWKTLLGIALYLQRTEKSVTSQALKEKLHCSEKVLQWGLKALGRVGFVIDGEEVINISGELKSNSLHHNEVQMFLEAIQEEQFRCQYFSEVPLDTIKRETNHL